MVDRLRSASRIGRPPVDVPEAAGARPGEGSFASALAQAERQESLRLSAHAQKRLDSAHVRLTDSHLERIDGAVARATEKGSNQSLIMLDKLALVVSVKNKTVITAMDETRMKEGVFTNIDSVVIA